MNQVKDLIPKTPIFEQPKIKLNNGVLMPAVGLGTYRIRDPHTIMSCVDYALAAGYRLFDTAAVYRNEVHLQSAFKKLLPKYGLEREDIFITSKLAPGEHGVIFTENAYKRSLDNLGVDYIDLFLIHFPGTSKVPVGDGRNAKMRQQTWAKLTQLYDNGQMNAIGVSNFTLRHLQELLETKPSVIPAVNQIEWHPFYHETELYKFCKKNDIALQAYCSFGGGAVNNANLLSDPKVKHIAQKLEATPAQVLLTWSLQQDVAVIPKSTNPEHIKENISLHFKISDEDMRALSALGENSVKFAWDPRSIS